MTVKPKDDYTAMLERIQQEADSEEENKLNTLKEKQSPISKAATPPVSFVSNNSHLATRRTPTREKPAPVTNTSSIDDQNNGKSSLINNQKSNADMLFSKFMCKLSVASDASRFKKTTPPTNKLD